MKSACLGALLLSLGIAEAAVADPVTLISGGGFAYYDGSLTTFQASGSGFSVIGSGAGNGFVMAFDLGQTITPNTSFNFIPGPMDNGSMTIGGDTHQGFVRGTLQVTAEPFVVPAFSNGAVSTRFTINGLVQLFSAAGGTLLFSQDVVGAGVMSFAGTPTTPGSFLSRSGLTLTFDSGSTGSPTPEPASMLLLGTGLAAAWQARRLRRAR